MKKIYILYSYFLLFATKNLYGTRTFSIKNNQTDNFDIMYKKKAIGNEVEFSEETLSSELEKYIYSIVEIFSFWEKYRDSLPQFNTEFVLFSKDFFGIRLEQKNFTDQTKRQMFIDGLVEKVVYFYQKTSDDMKYKLDIQIDYFNSFRFEILQKISFHDQIDLISLSFLCDLFFNQKDTKYTQQEENPEPNDTKNSKIVTQDALLRKDEEHIIQLITESAEIGLLDDARWYKIFNETIMNQLHQNNFIDNLYFTKDIFLDKSIYSKNNYNADKFIDSLKKIYKKDEEINNDFIQIYITWLLQKETIDRAIQIISNEDYLFILFLTVIIAENIDTITYDKKISDEIKTKLKKKGELAKTILNQLAFMADKKKINWHKIPPLTIRTSHISNIISLILD
jgi:hypothetical protein